MTIDGDIRFALPKGRNECRSNRLKLLLSEHALYAGYTLSFLKVKQKDIPRLLKHGIVDIGISSTEWQMEHEYSPAYIHRTLWCNTRISLLARSENVLSERGIKCVTEFPNIASRYFSSMRLPVDIFEVSGSVEPLVSSYFDCGIDCVETGASCKANGVAEIEPILLSTTNIYSNQHYDFFNSMTEFLDEVESSPIAGVV